MNELRLALGNLVTAIGHDLTSGVHHIEFQNGVVLSFQPRDGIHVTEPAGVDAVLQAQE